LTTQTRRPSEPVGGSVERAAGSADGLSSVEAARRLAEYGPNALPTQRRTPVAVELVRQLTHFFALLLWVAAALAAIAGMPQLCVAIVVVILVNGGFAFAQEYRADRAVERLRELLPSSATVRRDRRRRRIPISELVPDDVVRIEAGDHVSADLSVIGAVGLAVDESMLTGESVPRRAGEGAMLFAGTFVVEGSAEALAVATGSRTRLAAIATLARGAHRQTGPLALRLRRVVMVVGLTSVCVGTVLFGVSLLLGLTLVQGFLFALGVTVALVPEGLLPTVTLSLASGARVMAEHHALVRRLEAVETLGSVTFICTDKTGTLTRNEMAAVEVWTLAGSATVSGTGYDPAGEVDATAEVAAAVTDLAYSAVRASTGTPVMRDGRPYPQGDPMEVALYVLGLRAGLDLGTVLRQHRTVARRPFDPRLLRSAAVADGALHVKGAPERVLEQCALHPSEREAAQRVARDMAQRGLRVLAVARGPAVAPERMLEVDGLRLLGVVGLFDPPREEAAAAIAACRRAQTKLAVVTGDHPGTALAVARQVGLAGPDSTVVSGHELPPDDAELGAVVDRDGIVIARVSPEQKLRIAQALQRRGHVVAMTGDGVNDAPALRAADIGIAMGATGSDVAREAADLILLDDNFVTIVRAIELGRATFANIRRFLTYHLTDNVAELAPFVAWALTGGAFPLAIGVLQVLALDIGTDMLPALALGAEPPHPRTMSGAARTGQLIDRRVAVRAFGLLGPAEVVTSLGAFAAVLYAGGWRWGAEPAPALLATASGTAFAAIVLGQLANAYACRSDARPFFRLAVASGCWCSPSHRSWRCWRCSWASGRWPICSDPRGRPDSDGRPHSPPSRSCSGWTPSTRDFEAPSRGLDPGTAAAESSDLALASAPSFAALTSRRLLSCLPGGLFSPVPAESPWKREL
jgi:calcium-translocating P-type ATPase